MRQLRIQNDTDEPFQKVQIIKPEVQETPKSGMLVDKYATMALELKALDDAHKAETAGLREEVKELTETLKAQAQKQKVTKLDGDEFKIEFKPKTSRKIDPAKLLLFFRSVGKASEFLTYVKVGLTQIEDAIGKAVLANNGLVESEVDEYSSIRVTPKHTH